MTAKSKANNVLGRDAILDVDDVTLQRVRVPEFGGHVYVRSMDGHSRFAFEKMLAEIPDNSKGEGEFTRARMTILCACDADGNLLFTEDDVAALMKKNTRALMTIADAGMKLAGLSAEAIEDEEKN